MDYFLCDVSTFYAEQRSPQGLRAPRCELAFICGEIEKFYEYKVISEFAKICFCFISNVLFSNVVVHFKTVLNATSLLLKWF